MNNLTSNSVIETRKKALLLLIEISYKLDTERFTIEDFLIDKVIRMIEKLPIKDIGKEPYDYIDSKK